MDDLDVHPLVATLTVLREGNQVPSAVGVARPSGAPSARSAQTMMAIAEAAFSSESGAPPADLGRGPEGDAVEVTPLVPLDDLVDASRGDEKDALGRVVGVVALALVDVARWPRYLAYTGDLVRNQARAAAAIEQASAPGEAILVVTDLPSATFLTRSSVDSERAAVQQTIASVFDLAGMATKTHDAYPAWTPDPVSPLLTLMESVYRDLFGHEAEVMAIHAALETSTIGAKKPGLDMISIGPTVLDVHTPDEHLEVASVGKVYDLLVATLDRLSARE